MRKSNSVTTTLPLKTGIITNEHTIKPTSIPTRKPPQYPYETRYDLAINHFKCEARRFWMYSAYFMVTRKSNIEGVGARELFLHSPHADVGGTTPPRYVITKPCRRKRSPGYIKVFSERRLAHMTLVGGEA